MNPPEAHIVVLSALRNQVLLESDLHLIHGSAGFQVPANTEESNEADKNLFRLTPYGALPDW